MTVRFEFIGMIAVGLTVVWILPTFVGLSPSSPTIGISFDSF
jgi:hypothetical protein